MLHPDVPGHIRSLPTGLRLPGVWLISVALLVHVGCQTLETGPLPVTVTAPVKAATTFVSAATTRVAGGTPTVINLPAVMTAARTWWQPPVTTRWQWQLTALPVDQSFAVDMYDIDLFENAASTVAALHAHGAKVVCYINVGSWEDWRPDQDQFPAAVIGKDYKGWPGEKWLDIRQIELLAPVMLARFDQCLTKGFDAIEPDNIDGYANDTGFAITAADQLRYNRWLAQAAHQRGLSIGLKNDADQVPDLLAEFDWALTEDCFQQGWCEQVRPFIQAGKPVFAAEYRDTGITLDKFCPQAKAWAISAILKDRDLTAWRQACP